MAALPQEAIDPVVAAIYAAREREEAAKPAHRSHMGASLIGDECPRKIWFTWRWAAREAFSGRMLRLFETGNMAEARFVADLRRAGAEVLEFDPAGKQWRINDFGGHFGGSMDGVATNLPGRPKSWAVLEFKTHSAASFATLQKQGVAKAKPAHYAQVQVYMRKAGLERCLYLAVNKNTDDLYSDVIVLDKAFADQMLAKAGSLLKSETWPQALSKDPSFYLCKMCKFASICHAQQLAEVTCRSCAHSTAVLEGSPDDDGNGRWSCAKWSTEIPLEAQRTACGEHRYNPIWLQRVAEPLDYVDGAVVYKDKDGRAFANGDGTGGTLTSQEIHDFGCPARLADACEIRAKFPASTVVVKKAA